MLHGLPTKSKQEVNLIFLRATTFASLHVSHATCFENVCLLINNVFLAILTLQGGEVKGIYSQSAKRQCNVKHNQELFFMVLEL